MHGNLLNKNKSKMFLTANSDLAARISILENNVYKVTYYEIISGASGTLTIPTGATINSGEFSGANCILSEINGSNKPTFVTPLDGGGTPVTSTLNVGTGAWVKSGVTVSTNVALIYSVDITAADYQNLNNFYIIDNVLISSLSQVLTNSGTASTLSSELSRVISDETGSGALVFGTSPTFVTDITTPLIIGGTTNTSYIINKATTGNGASADPAHVFTGGANGGTEIMRLLNGGKVGIGAIPTGAGYLQVNSNTTDEVASFTSSDAIAYIALTDSTGTGYLGTGSTGRVFIGSVASVSSSNLVIMGSGNGMGYGVTSPSITGLHIQKTAEQLRLGYDASNYISTTVASTGEVTNTLVGTTRNFNFSSAGSMSIKANSAAVTTYLGSDGGGGYVGTNTAHAFRIYAGNTQRLSFASGTGACTVASGLDFTFDTATGSKLGTATTQKFSFWNATPIVQPTTAGAAATFTANAGTAVNDASTFDGYTLNQVVKALRNIGLLA